MSFRTKLFLLFLVTVLASVSAVTYSVTHYTRSAYEEMDAQRPPRWWRNSRKNLRSNARSWLGSGRMSPTPM
jgi:hypothetical protein